MFAFNISKAQNRLDRNTVVKSEILHSPRRSLVWCNAAPGRESFDHITHDNQLTDLTNLSHEQ